MFGRKDNVDTDEFPSSSRCAMLCVHCRRGLGLHYGWACKKENAKTTVTDTIASGVYEILIGKRSELPEYLRFTTTDMVPVKITEEKDSTHWRAWAHNQPGDCSCGIKREMCIYHK